MEDETVFMEMIFDLIENLSYDKVINVRITLGSFLQKIWNKKQAQYKWVKTNKKMLELIYRLKNDESPDVNMTLKEINIDDVKKGLTGSNLNDILLKKDINKEFDNKFEELKSLMGFTPTIFSEKK